MTVRGGKSLRRSIIKLQKDINRRVNDEVSDGLDATERRAKRNLVEKDAVATTETFNSFVKTRVATPEAERHTLTNESPHAQFVEWGTGAKFGTSTYKRMPMNHYAAPSFSVSLVAAIARWITIKPGFRRGGPGEAASIPIARVIAGETDKPSGTAPQPFMRPAWFFEKPKLKANVRLAVKQALRRA